MLFNFIRISFFVRNRIVWLCVFLLSVSIGKSAIGDSVLNGLRIEGKVQYGFIYPHNSLIEYLLKGNIHGVEVIFSTASKNRHPWESLYRYPRYGAGYNYTDYSNKDVLGKSHALFGFCEIPFFYPKNQFMANYKIDFGFAYNSKVFDPETNPLNQAISSRINAFVGFDFNAEYTFNANNRIKFSLDLTHCSNGKIRSPNLGINTVTVSTAWAYSIIPLDRKYFIKPGLVENKRHIFETLLNVGLKRDDMLDERLYRINSVVGDYYYCFSPKYGIGGGLDFFYDESLAPTKEHEDEVPGETKDNYQMGGHFCFMVRYGNFSVVMGMGHYLVATYHKYTPIYSRFGMRYAIKGRYMLNFTVKAHYAIADYVEWGIGYRFNTKGL